MAGETAKKQGSRMLTYLAAGFVLPVIVIVLGNVFFSLAAMLNGDQKHRPVSGPPSVDGPAMPWYWHWQHELMAHLLLLWIVSVGVAALLALLRRPYAATGSTK